MEPPQGVMQSSHFVTLTLVKMEATAHQAGTLSLAIVPWVLVEKIARTQCTILIISMEAEFSRGTLKMK